MLLHIIFFQFISIALASDSLFNISINDLVDDDNDKKFLLRFRRNGTAGVRKKDSFIDRSYKCSQMDKTHLSPFVVIILLKSSGRFLGMGSIIGKQTILTAARVVEQGRKRPTTLRILAGRISPWWGEHSQIRHATEIHQNDLGLALMLINKELVYNKNIKPISLCPPLVPFIQSVFEKIYDQHWEIFGIARSSWDVPGEAASKSTVYVMRTETVTQKQPHEDACKAAYPEVEFNDTAQMCTYANASLCWGCIGSPTVALTEDQTLLQIAVLTSATTTEIDEYHIHTKVCFFEQWIRSHSYNAMILKE